MVTIRVETTISAPIEKCFDLARSMSAHTKTTGKSRETVVSQHDHDLLELNEEVTFEATHLGVRQRLTAKVTQFDYPNSFTDEMTKGTFRSLKHQHIFETVPGGKVKMIDEMTFESPLPPFGRFFDLIFMRGYMERFARARGLALKELAESA